MWQREVCSSSSNPASSGNGHKGPGMAGTNSLPWQARTASLHAKCARSLLLHLHQIFSQISEPKENSCITVLFQTERRDEVSKKINKKPDSSELAPNGLLPFAIAGAIPFIPCSSIPHQQQVLQLAQCSEKNDTKTLSKEVLI